MLDANLVRGVRHRIIAHGTIFPTHTQSEDYVCDTRIGINSFFRLLRAPDALE